MNEAEEVLEHFHLLHFQNAWRSHITTALDICPIALCLSVSDTSQNKSQDGRWWRLATNRKNKHFHYIIKSATTQSKLATSSRPSIESSQSLVMERIPLFGLPGTRG